MCFHFELKAAASSQDDSKMSTCQSTPRPELEASMPSQWRETVRVSLPKQPQQTSGPAPLSDEFVKRIMRKLGGIHLRSYFLQGAMKGPTLTLENYDTKGNSPSGLGTSRLAAIAACCASSRRPAKIRGPRASRKAPRQPPAAARHSWFSQERQRNSRGRNSSTDGLNACTRMKALLAVEMRVWSALMLGFQEKAEALCFQETGRLASVMAVSKRQTPRATRIDSKYARRPIGLHELELELASSLPLSSASIVSDRS